MYIRRLVGYHAYYYVHDESGWGPNARPFCPVLCDTLTSCN